ncbi:MAG: SpoIIE family protein phosphatase [Bacteroidales bacterium]|nr:SpoIIE family protein phosphatase [Bacteroidales bacterium]
MLPKWLTIDFEDENKFRLFLSKTFMIIGILAVSYFMFRAFYLHNIILGYGLLVVNVLLILFFIYVIKTSNHIVAGHSVSTLMLSLSLFLIYNGGENLTGPLWAYTVPISSFSTTGKKIGVIHVAILFVFLIFAFILFPQYFPPYDATFKLRLIVSLLINTMLIFFFEYSRSAIYSNMLRSREEKNRLIETISQQNTELNIQKQSLQKLYQEIEQKNIFITDSIKYARRIQASVMPQERCFEQLFSQHFILNSPKNIISGDFYYLHKNNDVISIAVGDCSGHGVPGAYLSLISLVFLDQIFKTHSETNNAEKLHLLESKIMELLKINFSEFNNDSIELSLCSIDTKNKIINCSLSNQDLILQIDDNAPMVICGQPFSLCDRQPDEIFTVQSFSFKEKVKMVLFTDGFADQLNEQSKKFSKAKMYKLIEHNIQNNFHELKQMLEYELVQWRKNTKQTDDICVIGINYFG